jgi:shikimate kinase
MNQHLNGKTALSANKNLLNVITNSNQKEEKSILLNTRLSFSKPTILAFMGIPGSGKSTIARHISSILNVECFVECEEESYPEDIKRKLKNSEKDENILDIHYYFRNMRANYHQLAYENKKKGMSSIMDSFFSKLMNDIIQQPNTDWFINSKNKNFYKIKEVSEYDSKHLQDADVIIFLNVSKDLHKKFLEKRHRSAEVSEHIHLAQEAFLQATRNYVKEHKKKLIVVEQEFNINKKVKQIVELLKKEDVLN